MKISELNGRILDSKGVYVHDDILNQLQFDRFKKKLCLSIIKQGIGSIEYAIEFINVIGFEMTSCDFWGPSPHILDFEYIEPDRRIILPKFFERIKSDSVNPCCNLLLHRTYIESVITFASGDRLIVACEYIIFGNNQ